ncbi:DUF2244 domain-containing protein [uncultured Roseibium sp.]|uniref:DUF2244 domain-containing protein n=1 Tax=uncultured Roseibium sp. TaxID=1936171 RepID=UPI002593B3DE|nr:DUF2244 domain-containing protein [uncultured Roseibium sp.]
MTADNPKPEPENDAHSTEEPFFSAVLTPYRSLSPRGFMVFMLCVGAVSFISGIAFLAIGAWPVFGFFGLDVLLIWLAFRLNYASAKTYEEVVVSAHEIVVRKVGPGKRHQEFRFNPLWVRMSMTRLEDEGVTRLSLSSRGEHIDIGNFLNPEDRTSFAGAMANALATAKAGSI